MSHWLLLLSSWHCNFFSNRTRDKQNFGSYNTYNFCWCSRLPPNQEILVCGVRQTFQNSKTLFCWIPTQDRSTLSFERKYSHRECPTGFREETRFSDTRDRGRLRLRWLRSCCYLNSSIEVSLNFENNVCAVQSVTVRNEKISQIWKLFTDVFWQKFYIFVPDNSETVEGRVCWWADHEIFVGDVLVDSASSNIPNYFMIIDYWLYFEPAGNFEEFRNKRCLFSCREEINTLI